VRGKRGGREGRTQGKIGKWKEGGGSMRKCGKNKGTEGNVGRGGEVMKKGRT